MLLLGMLLAGMTQVILPADLVGRWMGSESGIVGVLIGAAVGSLVPAGPFVVFPLLGSILATGAGAGAVAAFITAWSVTPVSRTLVWELPFLGGAFTASRFIVMLPFPILAGAVDPADLPAHRLGVCPSAAPSARSAHDAPYTISKSQHGSFRAR